MGPRPIRPTSRSRLPSGKRATSAQCKSFVCASARRATSWNCNSRSWPTASRRIDPRQKLVPVNAVIPWNAERAGLNRDNDRIARVKAIIIISVDGQPLVSLPFPPGVDEQAAGAAYDFPHVVAAVHRGGGGDPLFFGSQFSLH